MSGCGFRGRGFGPRGARSNGPANGFGGPRFPHPNFNHPRPPPNRIPGPSFVPWQSNVNFSQRPQYRGNLQFRPNGRGRAPNGRGIARFSGPGRPPAPQFPTGFVRNPRPRAPLLQQEHVQDQSVFIAQTPLLGSEEERQQKITETADKLKQKLSSITEEDLTNFWEDDLSILPHSNSEQENIQNKGIPELRHEPPELDLTFTDFRDIGRVNFYSKCENLQNATDTSDVVITFDSETTNRFESTNDEITIVNEHREEPVEIITVNNNIASSLQVVSFEDERSHEENTPDQFDSSYNYENLNLRSDDRENILLTHTDDISEHLSVPCVDENAIDLSSTQLSNNAVTEALSDLNNVENTFIPISVSGDQGILQTDVPLNEDILQIDTQQNDNVTETNCKDTKNILQSSTSVEEPCRTSMNVSVSPKPNLSIPSPSNEEIKSNTVCDPQPPISSHYNELHKSGENKKLNNPHDFQVRPFNGPPRFGSRIPGPRCRWPFQQNGNNLFFRGPQRLPIRGNRIPPPRHIVPFPQNDLVPIAFDPRAPPPYRPNVPVSNHDPQHHSLLPFPSSDLPPSFDPSAPPPNVRSKPVPESPMGQEILQPPPAFDPRGPPPRITSITTATTEKLHGFNPQQRPPKIHNQDDNLQPPRIFDPRLSSQERSNLITPLDSSGSNVVAMNLMETPQVTDFTMTPVPANFSQLPPINMRPPQPFIPNMQMGFQPVLPHTGQVMTHEFPLPPPHINVNDIPPPPPKTPLDRKQDQQQTINIDDGLEDMQEAMEFAKQVMNMTGEMEKSDRIIGPVYPESLLSPSSIPVPNEDINLPHSSSFDQLSSNITEKSKKRGSKSKASKQDTIYGPELVSEQRETTDYIKGEEHNIENQSKSIKSVLFRNEQVRPKVVFNLNSKLKKINKQEEWHESEEAKQKKHKHSDRKRNNLNKSINLQKEHVSEKDSTPCVDIPKISVPEKVNDVSVRRERAEKWLSQCPITTMSKSTNVQKPQKSKKQTKKVEAPASESSWKDRVINRFLKMSKNDICNMVNNSSLRKFDIAMKHLVKERRSSFSLEMRNTEDEKMKEYDREEFMNQLNAMLDPSAVVGITDLPTEFIHHLSEVLQLDPLDSEVPVTQDVEINELEILNESNISKMCTSEDLTKENVITSPITKSGEHEITNVENERHFKSHGSRDKISNAKLNTHDRHESNNASHSFNTIELDRSPSQEENTLSKKYTSKTSHSLNDPGPSQKENNLSKKYKTNKASHSLNTKQLDSTPPQEESNLSKKCPSKTLHCLNIIKLDRSPSQEENNSSKKHNTSKASHSSSTKQLDSSPLQGENNSSKKHVSDKAYSEVEVAPKKQQPLFNEADLDNILSEVTERTNTVPKTVLSQESRKSTTETHKVCTSKRCKQDITRYKNPSPQIRNRTTSDLDDIFTAGIARAKLTSKIINSEHSRSRKSTSEDRSTFRKEKCERWNRKEREEPDAFRNLTKEEWEAKYGRPMNVTVSSSSTTRRSGSNSSDNLNRDRRNYRSQRYCSSDSPMRNLSISPLVCETRTNSAERSSNQYNGYPETKSAERSESSCGFSTSSSDSDSSSEETVAPDVTKLLKVIKEKEKIAKKKSLNETIRDEVAAEIEKKWKEKSKHKERKSSRKRERRKREKKEKRKKDKKKRRWRTSQSDTSRSNEQVEETRLLTEDEIKKEVIVKEESDVTSVEWKDACNKEITRPCSVLINKVTGPASVLQSEAQNSQMQKQQVAVTFCNTEQGPVKSKLVTVTSPMQPKTKAQLKQMPESSDMINQKVIENSTNVAVTKISAIHTDDEKLKESIEICKDNEVQSKTKDEQKEKVMTTNNNEKMKESAETSKDNEVQATSKDEQKEKVMSTNNNEKMKESAETSKDNEVQSKGKDEQREKVVSTNNNSLQIYAPLNITELLTADTTGDNSKSTETTWLPPNNLNRTTCINTGNQQSNQQLNVTSTPRSTESRSGCKKIDIKAYKERALQRRLREQNKLDEITKSPVSLTPEIQCTSTSINNKDIESLTTEIQRAMEEICGKESTEKDNPQRNVHSNSSDESSVSKSKDKSSCRIADSSSTTVENSVKSKDNKADIKSLSKSDIARKLKQGTGTAKQAIKGSDKSRVPVKSKSDIEQKKSAKMMSTAESNKFKNIRSEGSKELKLKKEKIKRSKELKELKEKKESTKMNEFTLSGADSSHKKHVGKHSAVVERESRATEETQKTINTDVSSTIRAEIYHNTNSRDNRETSQSETLSSTECLPELQIASTEVSPNSEQTTCSNTERINIDSVVKDQDTQNKEREVFENPQTTDREEMNVTDEQNNIKESQETTSKTIEENDVLPESTTTEEENTKANKPEENDALPESTTTEEDNATANKPEENDALPKSTAEESTASPESTTAGVDSVKADKLAENSMSLISSDDLHLLSTKEPHTQDELQESTNTVDEESSSLNKCFEVNAEENINIINIDGSTKQETDENRLDNYKDNFESLLDKSSPESTSSECNKILESMDLQTNEFSSPGSAGSPFKGFLAESIVDDIRDASELLNLHINTEDITEKITENPKEWLEKCFETFHWKKIEDDKTASTSDGNTSSKETEVDAITFPSSHQSLENKGSSIGEKIIAVEKAQDSYGESSIANKDVLEEKTENNHQTLVCETAPEKENANTIEESKINKTTIEQSSPIINENSKDMFDEDSEPFIVLDEYIDDTDGKSVEKLNTINLDFEDYIARDVDTFTDKNFQEKETDSGHGIKSPDYDSGHFKVLSKTFDEEGEAERDQEEKTSLKGIEENSKSIEANSESANVTFPTSKVEHITVSNTKSDVQSEPVEKGFESTDLIVREIPSKSSENLQAQEEDKLYLNTISKDIPQVSATTESSHTEIRKTEKKNLECSDKSESTVKKNFENFKATSSIIETPKRLNVPTKAALKKSVESLPVPSIIVSTKNNTKLNTSARNESLTHSSSVNAACGINARHNPVVGLAKSKDVDNLIENRKKLADKFDDKTNKREQNDTLHKIKSKPKMKHKQEKKRDISEKKVKEAVKSNIAKVGHPNTKETIMARMIEIDVEIHKLMTEKMTLYEMLKSGALPVDDTSQNDNPIKENKETEVTAAMMIRPRTPSALVSQLIQNIEASPVVSGQSTKGTENALLKESTDVSQQSNKQKASSKRKLDNTSSYSSDDEEVMHYTGNTKSVASKRRKKQQGDRAVKEKRHSNESTKSILKKGNDDLWGEVMNQDIAPVSTDLKIQGTQSSSSSSKNITKSSSRGGRRITDLTESQGSVEGHVKSRLISKESSLINDNETEMQISNEKETETSVLKLPENKTPDRLSIYSDDSTWESIVQNSGLDMNEQKKPSTGLALLEETYKKEIAESRKIKAEARKKEKKKQLRDLLNSVNALTPEEEELPLSTLYIKKLQQKKDLLDTLQQKTEEGSTTDDPQFWRNAVEVINAVAEDRVKDLYTEHSEEQCDDNSQGTVTKVPEVSSSPLNEDQLNNDIRMNSDSRAAEEGEMEKVSFSKTVDEVESTIDTCEVKDGMINDVKEDDIQASSSKLKIEDMTSDPSNNNEFDYQDSLNNIESDNVQSVIEVHADDTFTNIEQNMVEFCMQETVKNNDSNIDVSTSGESTAEKSKEEEVAEETVQEPQDTQQMVSVSENLKREDIEDQIITNSVTERCDPEIKDKSEEKSEILAEITLSEEVISEQKYQSQELSVYKNSEESSDVPKPEHSVNIKEVKGSQEISKDSEQSSETSSRENLNQARVSTSSSSVTETIDPSGNEDLLNKKLPKRKRHSSKTPLRRSSRYTEEITKRIKLETDTNTQSSEQESQERNFQAGFTSKSPTPLYSSYDEETENTPTNIKKSRGTQKSYSSKKRFRHSESETPVNQLVVKEEDATQIRKSKQRTRSQMMNCKVRLVDSKYTILKPNVNPNDLRKLGISTINLHVNPKFTQADSTVDSLKTTLSKDLLNPDIKQTTSRTDATQQQASKSIKKSEDITRSSNDQSSSIKIKKVQKSQKINPSISDKGECTKAGNETISVPTREQVTVDGVEKCAKPDIEIVEEKRPVTNSQHHDDPELTLPVIDTKDETELSRTQYTVHKGPILDIKVKKGRRRRYKKRK